MSVSSPGPSSAPNSPDNTSNPLNNVEQLTECSVCLETYSPALRAIQAACGHLTCAACKPTLNKCPECRVSWVGDTSGVNLAYTQAAVKIKELAAFALELSQKDSTLQAEQIQAQAATIERQQAENSELARQILDQTFTIQQSEEQNATLAERILGQSLEMQEMQARIGRLMEKKGGLKHELQQLVTAAAQSTQVLFEELESLKQQQQQQLQSPAPVVQAPDVPMEELEGIILNLEDRQLRTAAELDETVKANTELHHQNKSLQHENEQLRRWVSELMESNTAGPSQPAPSNTTARPIAASSEDWDIEDPKNCYPEIRNSLLYRETQAEAEAEARSQVGVKFFYPSSSGTTISGVISVNQQLLSNYVTKDHVRLVDFAAEFARHSDQYGNWLARQ